MTDTTIGEGIVPVEMPTVESDVTPVPMPTVDAPFPNLEMPDGFDIMGLVDSIKAGLRHEMNAAVADIERRLAQAREIEQANATGIPRQTVHAEDLNVNFHMIDGYNLTANSPGAGSIAWANLHIVLAGVDYSITDGNTALKYTWFVKPGSGTTATLSSSNTMPTLAAGDALIFINNAGTPVSVLESSVAYAVGPGVITQTNLDAATQTLLTTLQSNDIAMQARIDGVITSYYQNAAPWPAGSPSPAGGDVNQGDIWYDADDGGAFRWTGASGTPANSWQRIADTSTASIAALAGTRTTTYLSPAATTPTPVPAGGAFITGDIWMVTDQGNKLKRWSGTAWVDVLIGDAAIASGISGAKIGAGIDGANVTTGTVAATRIGAGVAGAALGSATGQVGTSQIATGAVGSTQLAGSAVTPAKINAAFHILY